MLQQIDACSVDISWRFCDADKGMYKEANIHIAALAIKFEGQNGCEEYGRSPGRRPYLVIFLRWQLRE